MLTDYGIRLSTPYLVEDKQIQNFRLSDQLDELVCIEEGVDAKISAEPAAKIFWDIINARRHMLFTYDDDAMSPMIKDDFELIKTAVEDLSRKLDRVSFIDNSKHGHVLSILSSRGTSRAEGFMGYDIVMDEATNSISLSRNNDDNPAAATYLDTYKAKSLTESLEGSYELSTIGVPLTSSTFKFTDKNNSNKWFILTDR